MVLTALACPMPAFNFDGKLGNWRFTEKVVAKRDSKNRPKGTIEEKDVNITSKRFMEKVLDEVVPPSEERWRTRTMQLFSHFPIILQMKYDSKMEIIMHR